LNTKNELKKDIVEDHSKRPGQSHLEWLNALWKHYVFYVLKALLLCISF